MTPHVTHEIDIESQDFVETLLIITTDHELDDVDIRTFFYGKIIYHIITFGLYNNFII